MMNQRQSELQKSCPQLTAEGQFRLSKLELQQEHEAKKVGLELDKVVHRSTVEYVRSVLALARRLPSCQWPRYGSEDERADLYQIAMMSGMPGLSGSYHPGLSVQEIARQYLPRNAAVKENVKAKMRERYKQLELRHLLQLDLFMQAEDLRQAEKERMAKAKQADDEHGYDRFRQSLGELQSKVFLGLAPDLAEYSDTVWFAFPWARFRPRPDSVRDQLGAEGLRYYGALRILTMGWLSPLETGDETQLATARQWAAQAIRALDEQDKHPISDDEDDRFFHELLRRTGGYDGLLNLQDRIERVIATGQREYLGA